jgi:hypothetical protein
MYTLSKKQQAALNRGERVKIALPPPIPLIETIDDARNYDGKLLLWAVEQFSNDCNGRITRATAQTIWLDMSDPRGGLTQFFGKIIPDIAKHSPHCLPPIPTLVVVVEISPPNARRDAARVQWPATYTNTLGYIYESDVGEW